MAPQNKFVEIYVFDDGNEKYREYTNKWVIVDRMFEGDKLKLVNLTNKDIIIGSISAWKVMELK